MSRTTGKNQFGVPTHMTRLEAEETSGRKYADQRGSQMTNTAPPKGWTWNNKMIDDMLARVGKEQEDWIS